MTVSFDGLERSSLPGIIVRRIVTGGWSKADLDLVEWNGQRAVVKDFCDKSLPVRLIGRIQITRELKAYGRLGNVEGVPRVYGRIDAHAFVMEEVRGRLLPRFRHRKREQRKGLLAQLRAILDAAHERGVIHNDVRGRDNVLVNETGRVLLVDFAGAVLLRPGGLAHRILFGLLVRSDESAYLKWKAILVPEELDDAERRRIRRYRLIRRFWILNPKGWGRFDAIDAATDESDGSRRER